MKTLLLLIFGAALCGLLTGLDQACAQDWKPTSAPVAGWQAIGVPMRDRYTRFVTLANAGARQMGFADAGAMWRAGYDMPPDSFVAVVDRLWEQVRPLYLQLHAYVRARLVARYGPARVAPNGMLPVHLLGNLWGQDWSNIADLVVWDKDPLENGSAPLIVMIDGVQQPLSNHQTRLRDRYRTLPEGPLPKAYDH